MSSLLADRVVPPEMTRAGDTAVRQGMDPGLVDFSVTGDSLQRIPCLSQVVGPEVTAGSPAAHEDTVGQADRFGYLPAADKLQRSWHELPTVAIDKLPSRIGEDAVVEEEQVAVGKFHKICFRDRFPLQDGQGSLPGETLVEAEEQGHLHLVVGVE